MLALTLPRAGNKTKFTYILKKHSCKHLIPDSFVTDLQLVNVEIFLIHSELLSNRSLGFKDSPLIPCAAKEKISDKMTISLLSYTKLQSPT